MSRVIWALCSMAIIAGCAEGSALITGDVRPAIENHASVKILTEMPDGAEQIAIVNASSDSGITQQQSLDYAVEELKKQAAKVGANAVVITERETETKVSGNQYGVSSSEVMIIEGVAVYVQ